MNKWEANTPITVDNLNNITAAIAADTTMGIVQETTAAKVAEIAEPIIDEFVSEKTQELDNLVEEANTATEGAEKVNISMVKTPLELTITTTNRTGQETSVTLDLTSLRSTWRDTQTIVRAGLGPETFPVGTELDCINPITNKIITWVVVAHDFHEAANTELQHTMTLQTKNVEPLIGIDPAEVTFDEQQALYVTDRQLTAGNYYMSFPDSTYCAFSLSKSHQIGSQFVFNGLSTSGYLPSAPSARYISIYTNARATSPAEVVYYDVVSVTPSNSTQLGTLTFGSNYIIDGEDRSNNSQNSTLLAARGGANYALSSIRQWLNSDRLSSENWDPATPFSRPPVWKTGLTEVPKYEPTYGFMKYLPQNFLDVVQPAKIGYFTNNKYEYDTDLYPLHVSTNAPDYYLSTDKFFLSSCFELGINNNGTLTQVPSDQVLPYYEGSSYAERIKYDSNGVSRSYYLREPYFSTPSYIRVINDEGYMKSAAPYYDGYCVAPMCIIA